MTYSLGLKVGKKQKRKVIIGIGNNLWVNESVTKKREQ